MLTFCGKHFAVYVTSLCDCVVHLKLFYGTRCQFHLIEIGVKKKGKEVLTGLGTNDASSPQLRFLP